MITVLPVTVESQREPASISVVLKQPSLAAHQVCVWLMYITNPPAFVFILFSYIRE
jgi:hypothetical protein